MPSHTFLYPSNDPRIERLAELIEKYQIQEAEKFISREFNDIDSDSTIYLHLQLLKSRLFLSQCKFDESLKLITECLEKAKKKGVKLAILDFLFAQADVYLRKGDNNYLFQKIQEIEAVVKKWKNIIPKQLYVAYERKFLNFMGLYHWQSGNYDKALYFYNRALSVATKMRDPILIAGAYNNIGLIFSEKGDCNEALKYFEQALKYHSDMVSLQVSRTLNNMGSVYRNWKVQESFRIFQ